MDAGFLNDLLECSVCLEQLDGTSKVLPCQHTFCKQCLEEIVHMHKELRCPECRVLVETRIDELPSNILLIRLLEGIKNNSRFSKAPTEEDGDTTSVLLAHKVETSCSMQSHISRTAEVEERRSVSKQIMQPSLCAKALHSHEAKEPGDLSFKKGDIIMLRKRIDQNWYQGELNGKSGLLPANYVQVVVPAPPQCKALYDFRVNSTDEKDCLTFSKGDLITVIRRVDENWAEGKLSEKIGIFPISFVEMNAAGRTVMKLSSNATAGPSRIAPPTPISDDSHNKQPKLAISPPVVAPCTDSSLTSTPSSPSNSSSSSLSPPVTTQASDPLASPLPTSSHNVPIPHIRNASRHHSDKRNSLCAPSQRSPKPTGPHRHSMEILNSSTTDDEALLLSAVVAPVPAIPPPLPLQWADSSSAKLSQRHGGSRKEEKSGDCPLSPSPSHMPLVTSNHSASTHAVVPIFYIALFNYKPQKEDELELRKGELYTVSEKCQDGWFKGTSLRCGKSGVFPGNYVQVAKSSMLSAQFQQAASSVANIRPASSKVVPVLTSVFCSSSPLSQPKVAKPISNESNNRHVSDIMPTSMHSKTHDVRTSISAELLEWARSVATLAPQKLQQSVLVATPQHVYKPQVVSTVSQHAPLIGAWPSPSVKAPEATMTSSYPATPTTVGSPTNNFKDVGTANGAQSWHGTSLFSNCVLSAASAVTPPNVSVRVTGNHSRMDRKERKDQQREKVSLMKRLTSKRKSRSPPLTNYSCDNPSFVDTPPSLCSTAPLPVIHVRSGSCPNEALGNDVSNHKKTSSLDGNNVEIPKSSYRPKQPVPLVRERFRCIVPYPPNSEYELELKVGDVVYVQKKREDGWYKGTQQRTGKTGLFPASFVESF